MWVGDWRQERGVSRRAHLGWVGPMFCSFGWESFVEEGEEREGLNFGTDGGGAVRGSG